MTPTTPKSDEAIFQFHAFCEQVRKRLEAGKRVYGDSSFERPLTRLVVEIQEELEDVTGWSFILHGRLTKIAKLIEQLENSVAVADATGQA